MKKTISIILIALLVLSSLVFLVQAQQTTTTNKINYIYQSNNKDDVSIMNKNLNQVQTQELAMLGNYSELKLSQNRYNQTIVGVEKQAKFLNLFQWQRTYEYSIVNSTLQYQPKWYDFMWKLGDSNE